MRKNCLYIYIYTVFIYKYIDIYLYIKTVEYVADIVDVQELLWLRE